MDKKYWESYYRDHGKDDSIISHSSFASFCLINFFQDKKNNIVEIGSGNGRDAIYFANHKQKVIAIDQSITALDNERSNFSSSINKNIISISDDFTKMNLKFDLPINIFYSRFTLHAISKQDEEVLLPKIYDSLEVNGLLCIEARTTNDPLCGVGEDCGDNTFLTDHRRRFIESNIFLNKVLSFGFRLLFFTEENNLSVHGDDNPVLMRIILKKV
jgi:cyclopropane fatty-acyl-phospholipid synthase-like methyltransferase